MCTVGPLNYGPPKYKKKKNSTWYNSAERKTYYQVCQQHGYLVNNPTRYEATDSYANKKDTRYQVPCVQKEVYIVLTTATPCSFSLSPSQREAHRRPPALPRRREKLLLRSRHRARPPSFRQRPRECRPSCPWARCPAGELLHCP